MHFNKSFQLHFTLALLIILVVISSSCSPKIKSWSQESISSPEISDIDHGGMAVLPVIVLS
ncbi:MAG: hypothetical protein KJO61_10110, partial [Deltaproteobacteria bacterium]|nr:hypothetical protein [Deltaproteobacteria bacterium]